MKPVTHILYDLGNTLLYLDTAWPTVLSNGLDGFRAASIERGFADEADHFVESFRDQLELYYAQREEDLLELSAAHVLCETLKSLGFADPSDELIDFLLAGFYNRTQQHWKPDPSAVEILQGFQRRGFHQAVLSNAAHDADVQRLVDRASFRPYLDFVLSSAAIGYRKPHPRAFNQALNRWDVQPDKVIMVGDTLNADILGAHNIGIRSVWTRQYVLSLPKNAQKSIQVDFEIDRLRDLPALIESLAN